jgi:hypothetical protein
MAITFHKSAKEVAAAKKEVVEEAPVAKAEAPSKTKLSGGKTVGKAASTKATTAKATGTVQKETVDNKTGEIVSQSEETVEVDSGKIVNPTAQTQNPVAWYSGGFTKNLGNFNSTRVNIGLSLPIEPAEIDEAYGFLKDWVDTRLQECYLETEAE